MTKNQKTHRPTNQKQIYNMPLCLKQEKNEPHKQETPEIPTGSIEK